MENYDKYKSAVGGGGTNEDIRWKSKGGIAWAVESGKKVHFSLDGIDLKDIIHKSFSGKNGDKEAVGNEAKNRSITGAELRWVYRNRDSENVKRNVIFWIEAEKVRAPWEEDTTIPLIKNGKPGYVTTPASEWKKYK